MIEVENLTKRFSGVTAIDNISFHVDQGEIVGFLGPNGAGKTTMMRILSCFLPATGGKVSIAGFDVFKESMAVRSRVGYLPENVPLYTDMRICEYLKYRGSLKGLTGKKLKTCVASVIDSCGLRDERKTVIGRLSRGFRQRVGLADALVHEPELLILDEPTVGLDPNQIRDVRALIQSLAQRYTVLLSSHILHEVEMICERVLIINKGKIVASDTPQKLAGKVKGNIHTIIELRAGPETVMPVIEKMPNIIKVSCVADGEWHRYTCECNKDQDVRLSLFEMVAKRQWELREMTSEKFNLEDVFVEITK